jgi:hypothetical protein
MKLNLGLGFLATAALLGGIANASADDAVKITGSYGLELFKQHYEEPSLNVEKNGWFGGVLADVQFEQDLWQLRLDGRLDYGRTDYSGSGTADGISAAEAEGRIMVGRAIPMGTTGEHRLTPYVGYGYRRFLDYFGGTTTSTGAVGYDRLSQYHYAPIGLELSYRASQDWTFKPTVEYDYLIQGYQDSYIAGDLHNKQNSGYGLRGSLMGVTRLGGREIEFGPFVRYWNIDRSNISSVTFNGATIISGYEPANNTTEVGLDLKLHF